MANAVKYIGVRDINGGEFDIIAIDGQEFALVSATDGCLYTVAPTLEAIYEEFDPFHPTGMMLGSVSRESGCLAGIKALETLGAWGEIRTHASALLARLTGDELARGYLGIAKAFEETATTGAEYRHALAFAQKAAGAADQGGLMWTWAHGRIAALSADLGLYQTTERAACAFLDALPGHPQAQALAPWVYFHLGAVRSKQGRSGEAVAHFRKTVAADAGEISERAQLHLAWTLAEGGRVAEAFDALPQTVAHVSPGLLHAACAVVFAAAGDWQGARAHAVAALRTRHAGEWRIYDTVQAAELATILQRAATHAGNWTLAASWRNHTAAILAGWMPGTLRALLPTLPQGGGAFFEQAASHSGPAGAKRCGARGAVG